jgi:hypothetical protein
VKAQHSLLSIAAAMIAAAPGEYARGAEEAGAMLSPQALQEIAQIETEIDRLEAQTIERLACVAGKSGPASRAAREADAVRQAALGEPQRGLCFLPHARGGLYRSRVGAKQDHRLLSRVGAYPIQQSQAGIARLRAALAGAALQSRAG